MSTYDITDITDRLEDLETYLDDLETELQNARDAQRDLQEYAEDIGTVYHLQKLADAFMADPHLHADLQRYVHEHEPAMDYRTAAMFRKLLELFDAADAAADEPAAPQLFNMPQNNGRSLQLAITLTELRTLLACTGAKLGNHTRGKEATRAEVIALDARLQTMLANESPF